MLLPGGGCDPGETELEALKREVKEELGIAVTSVKPLTRVNEEKTYATHVDELGDQNRFEYSFYTAKTDQIPKLVESHKFDGMIWVNEDEFFTLAKALKLDPAAGVRCGMLNV